MGPWNEVRFSSHSHAGVAVLSILVLIAVIVVIKMYRKKSSNYSVDNETKIESQRPSGSNPVQNFTGEPVDIIIQCTYSHTLHAHIHT